MSFQPGDLIWAKMRGYPHWPARIDLPAPNEKVPAKKYPIFFYGTHETAVMQTRDLFDYEKHKDKYSKPSNRRFFTEALEEILKNPKVRYGQRGMPVESESEESSGSEDEENEEEEEKEDTSTNQKQVQGKRRMSTENKTPAKKKAKTVESDSEEPVESDEPEESSESEGEEYVPEPKSKKKKEAQAKTNAAKSKGKTTPKKSKKMISSDESSDDDEDEDEKDDDESSKKLKKSTKKSESEDSLSSEEEKNNKKSSEDKNEVKPKPPSSDKKNKHKDEENENENETDEDKKKKKGEMERRKQEKLEKRKEELKEKKRKEKLEQKAKQKEKEKQEKEKERERKLKEKEKDKGKEKDKALREKEKEKARIEKEKQREKERKEKEKQKEKEKIEWQKQKERLKNPTIYDTLELCNQDLKLSLTVEAPDIQKCINTLNKINEMKISPDVIKKSPAIVQTIKKIRGYKQSNKVKERASVVYTKLKSLFIVSGADTPVTPTTQIAAQNLFTPAEQKITENSSKLPVVKEEKVDGKVVPEPEVRPVEETKEQPNLAETTAVHDKENLSLDHKTQNGAHNILENSIPSQPPDVSTTPMEDTQSYNEKTLQPEILGNDDQTEIFTPCDMEISSPI